MGFFRRTLRALGIGPRPELAARRWEAAETSRLNSAHWQKAARATGTSVNSELGTHGQRLADRCDYERQNNPTVEGVVNTFCDDLVGENGPTLQVLSDDEEYNTALESVAADVLADLSASGMLAFPDLLRLWCGNLWTEGELLGQIIFDPDATGPLKTRIHELSPRRLASPPALTGIAGVTLGVKRNERGRPISYYLSRVQTFGEYELPTGDYAEVPARDVIHGFLVTEAGQARGVPWLASSNESAADLRDYDAQVLDAARQAADHAMMLYSDHPDAEYMEVNEETEIHRRTIGTLPPGWKPFAYSPSQPSTTYVDYRSERQRDIGRPRGMPLMTIRLDSSKHSYSSARFDAQVYRRGIQAVRGWLARRVLKQIILAIAREAELYAAADRRWRWAKAFSRRPDSLDFRWTWQGFPHVDPQKEAGAQDMKLKNGTASYSQIAMENGDDPEVLIAQRAKDKKALFAAGLPSIESLAAGAGGGAGGAAIPEELAALAEANGIDIPSPAGGDATGAAAENAGDRQQQPLNGAQITAALEVMTRLREKALTPEAAAELLAQIGIERAKADAMARSVPALDAGQGDVEFKREVLKALLAVPAAREAIYNAVDIEDLVSATGLSPEANYQVPWIPLIAPAGEPVTGAVLKDSEGDVVGGVAETSSTTAGLPAGQSAQAPSSPPAPAMGAMPALPAAAAPSVGAAAGEAAKQ